jgi:hypothetical protein
LVAGRPSGVRLDPDFPGPIIQVIEDIDDRGRLDFPPRVAEYVDWFSRHATQCLMVLREPGRLELLCWDTAGIQVIERRRHIVESARSDNSLWEALRSLEDRYHRLPLSADRRKISLGANALLHLGAPEKVISPVYLVGFPDRIGVLSPLRRNQLIQEIPAIFSDLP